MAEKKIVVTDEAHTHISEYMSDYGCRSLSEALAEMVGRVHADTAADRSEMRRRREERLGYRTGARTTPTTTRTRNRSKTKDAATAPQEPQDGPVDHGGYEGAGEPQENGQHAHSGSCLLYTSRCV